LGNHTIYPKHRDPAEQVAFLKNGFGRQERLSETAKKASIGRFEKTGHDRHKNRGNEQYCGYTHRNPPFCIHLMFDPC
jgi:hypothetical protein